jgi:carbamoyltransferase
MKVLGISCGYHDAAVSYINDSEILFASHSERFSKYKHDAFLSSGIINHALQHGAPDIIAYYEKPWLKNTRLMYAGQWDDLKQSPWTVRGALKKYIPGYYLSKIPVVSFNHHLSHAAAGFQTSPFSSAVILIVDAIGEWQTVSAYEAEYNTSGNAKYKLLFDKKYPHSLGLFYTAMTKHVGLKPLDEEYIMMGMAAYGKDIVYDEMCADSWIDLENVKARYNHHIGTQVDYIKNTHAADIAASTQSILEEALRSLLFKLSTMTKSRNLVYGGGVALNCLANRVIGEYFPNIWIMPNPGDAGSSLGACALVYGKQLNWTDAYLGFEIPGAYPVDKALEILLNTGIVGIASGKAEFGPRALGNRSLLADPRDKTIKDRVNDIKHRQKYRPFAPAILAEVANQYFNFSSGWSTSNYMQSVAQCKFPDDYPAICHHDGSSRVQTVQADCKSGLRQLLEAWYAKTGCPMLLNTSLNIRGEPMVNDLNDAARFQSLYNTPVVS